MNWYLVKMFTEEQKRIHDSLKEIGEEISNFYSDALAILDAGCKIASKANLVAHLAREIDGGMRDVFAPDLIKKELEKQYTGIENKGHFASIVAAKNKKLWENISSSRELEKFMSSEIAETILKKYSVAVKEKGNGGNQEVDFERIQMNIEVISKGMEFYNQLRKKYDGLSKFQEKKIDTIISSVIKLEDLSEDNLRFESNLMTEIRKNNPEIFDQINITQNYLLESTLKFIVLKYNQALEKGIDLGDYFKAIEKKAAEEKNKYASAFNKIALNLTKGIAPSVKEIQLASNYFKQETSEKASSEKTNLSVPAINLNVLKQMVEWDSRMKILTQGQRTYLADFAYELKTLNSFHKSNAEGYLKTLMKAGFNCQK